MSSLEQRLVALGAALESPPAPDLVPGVVARLEPRRARRLAPPPRRTLALAFAVLLLAAGAAMAVTPSRHAILDFFGLRGATVERVPRLPPARSRPLLLGRPIPIARARDAAGFRALIPPGVSAAYLGSTPPGGRITLRVGRRLLVEFVGPRNPYLEKQIGPNTRMRRVRVNGGRGVYLSGAPHQVMIVDRNGAFVEDQLHVAGNVLLWQQGRLILRIEGVRSLREALALARSLR
jgi:hypothetical protein